MLVYEISWARLKKLCPIGTEVFDCVCKKYRIARADAINALARNDDGLLNSRRRPASAEADKARFSELQRIFDSLNLEFAAATNVAGSWLSLECQWNDDEMEGHGNYLRVQYVVQLSPAGRKLIKQLTKRHLTVYATPETWRKERRVTGV